MFTNFTDFTLFKRCFFLPSGSSYNFCEFQVINWCLLICLRQNYSRHTFYSYANNAPLMSIINLCNISTNFNNFRGDFVQFSDALVVFLSSSTSKAGQHCSELWVLIISFWYALNDESGNPFMFKDMFMVKLWFEHLLKLEWFNLRGKFRSLKNAVALFYNTLVNFEYRL